MATTAPRPLRRIVFLIVIIAVMFGSVAIGQQLIDDSEGELGPSFTPGLALDLEGGVQLILTPRLDPDAEGGGGEITDEDIDQAIEIIRQRIDGLGVAEPEITRQGDNVVVDLPGVRDREQAQEIVGRTAQLEFRPVRATALPFDAEAAAAGEDPCAAAAATVTGAVPPGEGAPPEGTPPGETTPEGSDPEATTPDGTAPEGTATTEAGSGEGAPATEEEGAPPLAGSSALTDGEHALGPLPRQEDTTTTTAPDDTTTTAPAGDEVPADEVPGDEAPADEVVLPTQADDDEPRSCVHMGPVGITGDALSKSQAQLGGTTGSEWVVAIRIEGGQQDAANALFNMCNAGDPASCPTRQMAIVLDEEVVSAPTVNEPNLASDEFVISGGRDETTGRGGFSEGEAKDLALVLRYGALPVEFATGAERQVSPTVGEDSLRAGVIAGLLGLGIVILYLLAYYRALGLIVVLGMAVWSALMYGVVTWLSSTQGLTLSLSGVVGIVISIGTTVDSYVVHFERLKDEVGLGKSVRSSTERGFQLAFRTILTANVAALIGAALLWWLTVGAVRGFAFFLGLSVLLDLFVIWTFERPMVALLARSRFFTEHRVFGVARGLGSRADRPAAAGAGALR